MTAPTVTECAHGAQYPLEPCTPCQQAADATSEPPAPDVALGPMFMARFDSVCPGCGFDLRAGQDARMVSRRGGPSVAHHDDCALELIP